MNMWSIIFAVMLIVAVVGAFLVWVSRFVWQEQKLAVRYATIAGAATLAVMVIGMEKL